MNSPASGTATESPDLDLIRKRAGVDRLMRMAVIQSVDRNLRNEDQEMVDDYQRLSRLIHGDDEHANGEDDTVGNSTMIAGDQKTEHHYHLPEKEDVVPSDALKQIVPPPAAATSMFWRYAVAALTGGALLGGGAGLSAFFSPDADPPDKPATPAGPTVDKDTIGRFQLDR